MRRLSLLLLFLLTLTACSAPRGEAVPTPTPMPTEGAVLSPWVEDYEEFWTVLEENYPLAAVLERSRGVALSTLKEKYRAVAEEAQSAQDLYRVLEGCAIEFDYTGHMSIVDADDYSFVMELFCGTDDAKGQYAYERLNNPVSRAFYGYEERKGGQSGGIQSAGGTLSNSQNLIFQTFPEEKAGYVEILSMNSASPQDDQREISAFFSQLEAEGYEHCIVDIRRNGGGSNEYPMQIAVIPNLTGPLWRTHYALVRGGPEILDYLDVVKDWWPLQPIENLPVEDLPNLNQADLALATRYMTIDVGITPNWSGFGEQPLFSGRFWLLTSPRVYSASEYFAVFCKDTGFATLVGETTGGDGVGLNPYLHVLPRSGICFQFSAENGLNLDGGSNEEYGTEPDIAITRGQDAFQVCLDSIAGRAGENG